MTVVVDIRTPDEWRRTGTIEGSHLLTFVAVTILVDGDAAARGLVVLKITLVAGAPWSLSESAAILSPPSTTRAYGVTIGMMR